MQKPKDLVILLHGITRSNMDMMVLENRLKKEGYDTLNIKYPSTRHNLDYLADHIYKAMGADPRYAKAPQVHFVAHSMGGLITRHLIYKYRPANLGKVCMMGTPNKGSEMADFMSEHKFLSRVFEFIFGPAGPELRTDQDKVDGGVITYPLGVIASNVSLNPIGNQVFGAANDTLVSIESTKIDGMADHIVVNSTHALMMWDPRVIDQVVSFIKTGGFDHRAVPAPRAVPEKSTPEAPQDPHP
ncbi:MAG: esterase/lipase family protein [Alphaproteobacteria bacterium]